MVKLDVNKIKNDKSIKRVSVENLVDQPEDIKLIGELKKSKKKPIIRGIIMGVIAVVITVVIITAVNIFMNYKIVQGNIYDSSVYVAGFSIIDKHYDASNNVKIGDKVYYVDQDVKDNQILFLDKDMKVGTVSKVYNDHVKLGNGLGKDISVKNAHLLYILGDD